MLIKIGDKIEIDNLSGKRFNISVAKIVGIEKVRPHEKYGHDCLEANIGSRSDDRRFEYVIDMDNGHWCYAHQVARKVDDEEEIKY